MKVLPLPALALLGALCLLPAAAAAAEAPSQLASTSTSPSPLSPSPSPSISISPSPDPSSPPAEVLELSPGGVRTLSFAADVGSALVSDPTTADVQVLDQRNLFVLAGSPGVTTLKVYGVTGALLGAYAVRVHVQSDYAKAVVSRIVGDEGDIRVDSMGDALFVSGAAKSPSQAEQVLRSIRAVSGDTPVVDALSLNDSTQVNLEVIISEVSRNVTQELGIDWSVDVNPFTHPVRTLWPGGVRVGTGALQLATVYDQTLTFPPAATGTGTAATGSIDTQELGIVQPQRGGDGGIVLTHSMPFNSEKYRATAFLEALAQNGLAVVHARPNLTAVSGQSAEFNSGLEIPVPTATERGLLATQYLETGVNLSFTPVVLDNNQISLTVQPRIREVTTGGATIGGTLVPNINQRSASTTVELGDGQSIAIAGLYRRSTTSTSTGIPLLKDIPVWGALFRSTRETDRSVELIIIVTPHIVAPVGALASAASDAPSPADSARQLDNEFYY